MAIPDNYIDKFTKDGESRMISPAADQVRVENEHYEGDNLDEVLDEIASAIDEAGSGDGTVKGVKVGSTTYDPDSETGVVDLSTPIADKVDKVPGKSLSTNDYTDADKEAVATISSKANASEVVKSISVNGTPQQKNEQGNVDINAGADVSVTTGGEGTIVIHVGDTSYPINLNHTHADMVKLVKFDESDPPATMDDNTIYVQVDVAEQPTEIEKLYLFGLEFAGGVPDTTPKLLLPRVGATIDFNNQSEVELTVKGKNLLSGIVLTGTGDFDITDGNGNDVSTISATDANDGVTLVLVKGSGFDFYGGTIEIASGAASPEFDSVEFPVIDSQLLPTGFIDNTAWNGDNKVSSGVYSAPGNEQGYVTTPFYAVQKSNSKFSLVVSGGFTADYNGVAGDLAEGFFVFRQASDSANTVDAYSARTIPRRVNDTGANANYISATMKKSELSKCFIFDEGNGQFLWKGRDVTDEDLVIKDTAWAGTSDIQTAPVAQIGYCTTPFFQATTASSKIHIIVHGGFVSGTDIERGQFVLRTFGQNTSTNAAYNQTPDPRDKEVGAVDGTFVSATIKMSEIHDCYIYDVNAGKYLWAGSNVDTSSAPTVQS